MLDGERQLNGYFTILIMQAFLAPWVLAQAGRNHEEEKILAKGIPWYTGASWSRKYILQTALQTPFLLPLAILQTPAPDSASTKQLNQIHVVLLLVLSKCFIS